MTTNINNLKAALFATQDGGAACDAISALSKHAQKGNEAAKQTLADYVGGGAIPHMRDYACACLAQAITEADTGLASVFQRGLADPAIRYWSILGYLKSAGKQAYAELVKIAGDTSLATEQRGHAVKCLATFSKQPFDRQLPSDPGRWQAIHLRLSEVTAWANAGYPDGQGYTEPSRHPALDDPQTEMENIVSRLDKKLAKKQRTCQDLANPTEWLAPANPADLQRIKARWDLPSVYLDFLTRFSPIQVTVANRTFYNHLQLFGAGELIEAQDGYSFNPVEQQSIKDWPRHLIVIASHGGDPFVLDLSQSNGVDAPVDTAEHGTGVWEFSREADSFKAFLETLAK